ncbi:MAG: pyruvate dehydrogenase (acetyl-transferring) E1 component subunit alpha [Rhodothermales bacterium]|nr:pyruvate dehydrogenase (acetyl-transferring) E1 component subunit alpha [Rhodothermales bacterium]MDG2017805.1 pyruvate dehydrogenase (acetyl-transferring) E1 component subunit alpha [Rhodothermales bacterium]
MAKLTRKPATKKAPAKKRATKSQADSDAQGGVIPDKLSLTVDFATYPAGKYSHTDCDLSEDQVLGMYRNMLLQRRFEERAAQMYGKQKIAGFLHLYIGQEAISTGTATAINIGQDSVITAYRDHGHGLALGMSPNEGMAEMFGKVGGCSRGKGGSMHFFSKEKGLFGGHGIVGAHVPVGVGIAFGHKYKESGGVAIAFYGDGAVGQGAIHEAANLMSVYELPAILVVENNQYAMGTSIHRAFGQTEFSHHSVAYDVKGAVVDGMDVFAVCKAMQDHVALARENKPTMMEIRTYRYRGHSMSDPQKYRTKEELESKKNEDPIIRLIAYILENKITNDDALDAIDDDVKKEVMASVEFAENSPAPELSEIYDNVYDEADYPYLS